MLATDSSALADCDAARLRDAGTYDTPADAICVSNAVSVPGIGDVLRGFGPGDAPVVFDPGPITGIDPDRARRLGATLRDLAAGREVVVTPNADETEAFAAALGVAAEAPAEPLRDALGVAAVVVHAHPASVVADADGTREVPAPDVERTARTGGGDCFVGGLTAALSGGWDLDPAVELANRCAAYRVSTDRIGGRADLL
ncbi:PfkB family carbohydrate kinase [Halosegnis marinus]